MDVGILLKHGRALTHKYILTLNVKLTNFDVPFVSACYVYETE